MGGDAEGQGPFLFPVDVGGGDGDYVLLQPHIVVLEHHVGQGSVMGDPAGVGVLADLDVLLVQDVHVHPDVEIGFPQEAFPIIVTIGYLVDPMATCLNSSGDTVASMMISRMVEGKGWMDKKSDRKTDSEKAAIAAQIGGCDCGSK